MKKVIISMMLASLGFVSCQKNEPSVKPTNLDQSSLTAKSDPGSVLLKWAVPQDSNYRLVRITYQTPDMDKPSIRNASVYSDSIRIDGLLARHGSIEFKLTPISSTGTEGNTISVSAQAEPKPQEVKVTSDAPEKVTLASGAADIRVSAPDPSEGKDLNALIDGNNNTYYHEDWHSPKAYPHYIVYKLPKALKAIHFFMKNRNHGNRSNPNKMEILMSDDFNGNFNPEENKAVLVKALTGLPDGQGAEYTSPTMLAPKAYQYVWFKITEVYNRQNYAAIAELQVYAHKTSIFDPETGKTTVE